MWHHVTMVTKFLDLNSLSWQRQHLLCPAMREKYGLPFCSWVQSCTGKSFFCLFLPYYLQDQGLLRSRYFATMVIWCNNFSSPYSHPIIGDSFQFWSSLHSDHWKNPPVPMPAGYFDCFGLLLQKRKTNHHTEHNLTLVLEIMHCKG